MVQHDSHDVVFRTDAQHLDPDRELTRQIEGRRWADSTSPCTSPSAQSTTRTPALPRHESTGTARRRARRSPCAATRAAQPHRAARPATPVRRARRAAGTPAGSCTPLPRLQPLDQPEPPLRRGQRHELTDARRTPSEPGERACRCPARTASSAGVGASNRSRMASSAPSSVRARLISRVASSECPPRSKKLSSAPTSGRPSTSANRRHSTSSCGVRGPRPPPSCDSRLRVGQGAHVELAVGVQRQSVDRDQRGGHHVLRQLTLQVVPQSPYECACCRGQPWGHWRTAGAGRRGTAHW